MKHHYQTTTDDNLRAVVATLLHTQNIRILPEIIEQDLLAHSQYPSLESARKALEDWGLPNMPVRVGLEQLAVAPLPALAHFKNGDFVLVEAVGKESVQYWDTEKGKQTLPLPDFEKRWSGALLLVSTQDAEVPTEFTKKAFSPRAWVLGVLASVGLVSALLSVALVSWHFLAWSVLKAVGIFFSVGLLSVEWGAGQWITGVCKAGKQTDCQGVLQSSASKLFSWLSWAEIGLFYFVGGFLVLLFASWQASPAFVLPILSCLAWCALRYVFFSVYYQARIAKQWCPLCLGVQVLFCLESCLAFSLVYASAFSLPAVSWLWGFKQCKNI